MAYLLAPYSVLMGSKGKNHKCCGLKIVLCGGFREDAAAVAECNIFDAEWCSVVIGSSLLSQSEYE